ncbi:MAG: hypothetical protein K8S98_05110 [Planctomycetes bacterium]|nr:hypothetical protein [Planctomycetota bacterium]
MSITPVTVTVAPANPCKTSAAETLNSCKKGAASDYYLARAMCTNLPAAEKSVCQSDALAAYQDALELCDDQFDERLQVCNDLGGAIYDPDIVPASFSSVLGNPYLAFVPGRTLVYEEVTAAGIEHIEVTVTGNTKVILGVTCAEVHDIVTLNGEPLEDTLDWYAQKSNGDVWYFGELSVSFDNGEISDLHGTWRGGIDGAKPGIAMKGSPHPGDIYRQEFLIGTAEDIAEVESLDSAAVVPYGSFPHCLRTAEYTPSTPGAEELKYYAPGIGLVLVRNLQTGERTELIAIK